MQKEPNNLKKIAGNHATTTVTIISLWTRRSNGPNALCEYDVTLPVGLTIFDTLQRANCATNVDGRPFEVDICATTSGDLMRLDGQFYLVAASGFNLLSAEQAANEISLADSLEQMLWSTRTIHLERQPGVPLRTDESNLGKFRTKKHHKTLR